MRQFSSLFAIIIVSLIRLYQILISPLIGNNCRYQPTCSEYTILSIKKWGTIRGLWFGFKRILRCHPFGKSGYDPPP